MNTQKKESRRPAAANLKTPKENQQAVEEATHKVENLVHPSTGAVPPAVGALSGMATGAVTGAIAGPPGMLAGAAIGTAIGAAAGILWKDRAQEDTAVERQLDHDIGVEGGNIGEALPGQPPARIGAFSSASMGSGQTEEELTLNEGPIPGTDE